MVAIYSFSEGVAPDSPIIVQLLPPKRDPRKWRNIIVQELEAKQSLSSTPSTQKVWLQIL